MKMIKILKKEYYVLSEDEVRELQKAIMYASAGTSTTRCQLKGTIMAYLNECIRECDRTDEKLDKALRIITHVSD